MLPSMCSPKLLGYIRCKREFFFAKNPQPVLSSSPSSSSSHFFFSSPRLIFCTTMAKSDHIHVLGSPCSVMMYDDHEIKGAKQRDDNWVIMEDGDDHDDNSENPISSSSSSSLEDSITSHGSSASSSDLVDDASSSSTSCSSSSSSHSSGPLYELSELMAQLPIKRGLSKYYQGKSQSFTSLSSVRSIEDLAKKENPYRRKMKACKSYAGGLDTHKAYTLPRAIISKKRGGSSSASLSMIIRRGSFVNSCRPPLIPVQKTL